MKKIFDRLFSTGFAGLYILTFAIAIGVATFIENDYGTDTAQKLVYSAKWFEVLLLLFSIALVVNIFKYRLFRKEKWSVFLFHISILIIFFGALITRYTGYEGVMNIREGSASNRILTNDAWLQTSVFDGSQGLLFENKVLFGSWGKNNFAKTYRTPQADINIQLAEFIPNAVEELQEDPEGGLIMELVVSAGDGQRRDIFLKEGETRLMGTYFLAFDSLEEANVIQFKYENDSLFFRTDEAVNSMQMSNMAKDTLEADVFHPFNVRTLYTFLGINLVMKSFNPKASLKLVSSSLKVTTGQQDALRLKLDCKGETKEVVVFGAKGVEGSPQEFDLCGQRVFVAYGSKYIDLPFSLKLNDFQLERYPGSNSPSSYASEVTLLDAAKGVNKPYRIFMNNVLNYRGFRFFQSSYDPDEKGTLLSVNHDYWGTMVSYLGYFLLALGMILTLFSKNSRFVSLVRKVEGLSGKTAMIAGLVFMLGTMPAVMSAKTTFPVDSIPVIDKAHADTMSRILVQDFKGRIKPLHTVASEVVRKISRKQSLYGQNSMQVLLSMAVFPDVWQDVPLIKLTHPKIGALIGNDGKLASFVEFFDKEGRYLLSAELERANQLKPVDRGTYEKELIKVDERLNVCNYVFSSALFKIFPREDTTDTHWDSPIDISQSPPEVPNNVFTQKFYTAYVGFVRDAVRTGNWQEANGFTHLLVLYQHKFGKHLAPSDRKIRYEVLYNKTDVFSRLMKIYLFAGFFLLIFLLLRLFNASWNMKMPIRAGFAVILLAFLAHTAGLLIRWYISGHAPWSNAYESLVYIAWASMLAGVIFMKRSPLTLAATAILASMVLMVAGLQMMDPELTPLVPVLKSYWLSIHVSMIVASYGFLALGALMGLLNLIIMILNYKGDNSNLKRTLKELTYINEMTITIGVFMLSIGTFLGGVWANESWGRYWGWDAKETWALVTILIYAFVLHMRLIPGYRGRYAFNLASVVAYGSVVMTYFGVNYYLSGLHSYATGDPVPIPTFVYYTLAVIFVIGTGAYFGHRNAEKA
ncbi:MAG: c-type cytochrome biogenesis protein CcsB [Saprospiraceae bacterium]|nr:c-type cytochrome biogenesis protein CcsB [Saprospiraceae bacterium]MCB9323759.1 c-type cytochrome biogenesis protein CcsB [Lewinellaceae bacterium]